MTNPSQTFNLHRVTTSLKVLDSFLSFLLFSTLALIGSAYFSMLIYLFQLCIISAATTTTNNYSSNMFSSLHTPPPLCSTHNSLFIYFFFSPCQLSRHSSLSSPPLPHSSCCQSNSSACTSI